MILFLIDLNSLFFFNRNWFVFAVIIQRQLFIVYFIPLIIKSRKIVIFFRFFLSFPGASRTNISSYFPFLPPFLAYAYHGAYIIILKFVEIRSPLPSDVSCQASQHTPDFNLLKIINCKTFEICLNICRHKRLIFAFECDFG